ncbi:MAG: ATP phosphoribosyltransferase [Candidatus Peregrinibacteria bacterium]
MSIYSSSSSSSSSSSFLRLAVQKKGRIGDESLLLLEKAGFLFSVRDRELSVRVKNFPLEIVFLRNSDIPELLADEIVDMAIVGQNTIFESEKRDLLSITKELNFGRCSLSLAVPKGGDITTLKGLEGKRIATSYPRLLKTFLKDKGVSADIIEMQGSVEIAPALEIADAICDLVSSGNTLRSHNLVEIEKMMTSEVCFTQRNNLESAKKSLVEEVLLRVNSVLEAKILKSIICNAPKMALIEIQKVLPGLDSPTIMPLLNPDWVALHSVVPEDEYFWEIIKKLKELGASGILIQPIERVIR